jgi:hypothetical protein
MKRVAVVLILALLLPLLSVAAPPADDTETVAFNTSSRKYHCLSCRWAKQCTANCIEITREEAKKRGGVPCKTCGGAC